MPINRDQFDKALDNTQVKIIEFLNQRPGQAFTTIEVYQGLGNSLTQQVQHQGVDWVDVLNAVLDVVSISGLEPTLRELVRKGEITSKTIAGVSYYAAKH